MTEEALYHGFVDRVLAQVESTSRVDFTAKRQKLTEAIGEVRNARDDDVTAAHKTAVGRYVMGEDDQTYAQSGLAVLWTTSTFENNSNGIPLAPDALYSPGEVTNGIRQGLVAALKQEQQTLKAKGAGQLRTLMPMLLSVMKVMGVEDIDIVAEHFTTFAEGLSSDATDEQKAAYAEIEGSLINLLRAIRDRLSQEGNDGVSGLILQAIAEGGSESREERDRLQAEVTRLTGQIATLQANMTHVRGQLAAKRATNLALHRQMDDCTATVNRLLGLVRVVLDVGDISEVNDAFIAQFNELVAGYRREIEEIGRLRTEAGEQQERIDDLGRQLTAQTDQSRRQRQAQRVAAEAALQVKLREQTATFNRQMEALTSSHGAEIARLVTRLNTEYNTRRAEMASRHQDELATLAAEHAETIAELRRELESAQEGGTATETELSGLRAQIVELQSAHASEIATLQAEHAAALELAAGAQARVEGRLGEANRALGQMEAGNRTLQDEIATLRQSLATLQASTQQEASRLQGLIDRTAGELAAKEQELQERNASLQTEIGGLRRDLQTSETSAQREAVRLQGLLSQKEQQLQERTRQNAALEAQINQLKGVITESEAKMTTLQQTVTTLQNEALALEQRASALARAELDASAAKALFEQKTQELEEQLAQLQRDRTSFDQQKEAAAAQLQQERVQMNEQQRTDAAQLQRDRVAMTATVTESRDEAQRARIAMEAANEAVRKMREELQQAEEKAEREFEAQTRRDLETEIARLEAQQRALKAEIIELESRTGASTSSGTGGNTSASAGPGANVSSAHVQGNAPSAAGASTSGIMNWWPGSKSAKPEDDKPEDDKPEWTELVEQFKGRMEALDTELEKLRDRLQEVKLAIEKAEQRPNANPDEDDAYVIEQSDEQIELLPNQINAKRKVSKPIVSDEGQEEEYDPDLTMPPSTKEPPTPKGSRDETPPPSMTGPQLMQWQQSQQPEQPQQPEQQGWYDWTKEKLFGTSYEDYAVLRGLVGQRGPLGSAAPDFIHHDRQLTYALPSMDVLERAMPRIRAAMAVPAPGLDASKPKAEERALHAALARFDAKNGALPNKSTPAPSPEAVAGALAALGNDFAITGTRPAHQNDARGGVERVHEVRWLPRGPHGRKMAKVAALEHAAARCWQVARETDTLEDEREELKNAAMSLKLAQLAPLYELHQAAMHDPESIAMTRPVSATGSRLVTRPCASVRGVLSYPLLGGLHEAKAEMQDLGPVEEAQSNATTKQAMMVNAHATFRLRTAAKRRQVCDVPAIFASPTMDELGSVVIAPSVAGTAAEITGASFDSVSDRIRPEDLLPHSFVAIVNRALLLVLSMSEEEGSGASLEMTDLLTGAPSPGDSAHNRREALWMQFRRNVGIAHDRLWVFVRTMSGCIGGDINEIIVMADEQALKTAKDISEQRTMIAKRVADTQAKIVETVVASMLKNSTLIIDKERTDDQTDHFVVIDNDARKQLRDLASGESGRPFFDASVTMRNMLGDDGAEKTKLVDILSGLSGIGQQIQTSLEQSMLANVASSSASLQELSHPSNSYFVSMRADAVSAIRVAHERLNVELSGIGVSRVSLWDCVEGGCATLTTRFAEVAGYLLVQARASTGVSAMYVSQLAIHTNAKQARIAMARLTSAAAVYSRRVGALNIQRNADYGALYTERNARLATGENITDAMIGQSVLGMPRQQPNRPYPDLSGWAFMPGGPFRRR